MAEEALRLLCIHVNKLLQVSYVIAMGRDSELYIKVAVSLFLISLIGILTGVLMVMMVPAFYERYENYIDGYMVFICNKARELYLRFEILAVPQHKKLS